MLPVVSWATKRTDSSSGRRIARAVPMPGHTASRLPPPISPHCAPSSVRCRSGSPAGQAVQRQQAAAGQGRRAGSGQVDQPRLERAQVQALQTAEQAAMHQLPAIQLHGAALAPGNRRIGALRPGNLLASGLDADRGVAGAGHRPRNRAAPRRRPSRTRRSCAGSSPARARAGRPRWSATGWRTPLPACPDGARCCDRRPAARRSQSR